mmetsp:Transcript_10939/g.24564  ORF Transcript_10939/g.24564 Transcript_10939/m.24564 type:complete len:251 (+) Transcript_10939:674-1426(+)
MCCPSLEWRAPHGEGAEPQLLGLASLRCLLGPHRLRLPGRAHAIPATAPGTRGAGARWVASCRDFLQRAECLGVLCRGGREPLHGGGWPLQHGAVPLRGPHLAATGAAYAERLPVLHLRPAAHTLHHQPGHLHYRAVCVCGPVACEALGCATGGRRQLRGRSGVRAAMLPLPGARGQEQRCIDAGHVRALRHRRPCWRLFYQEAPRSSCGFCHGGTWPDEASAPGSGRRVAAALVRALGRGARGHARGVV